MQDGESVGVGGVCAHVAEAGASLGERLRALTIPSMVVCEHGVVVATNEIHQRMRGPDGASLVGKTLHELFGDRYSDPTLAIVRQVVRDGRSRTALVFWRGHWMRVRYGWLDAPPTPCCLVYADPWRDEVFESTPPDGEPPIEFTVHDLGDLAGVTCREAEVLWMIGQGLSLPAIAKSLSRSTKTVETHVRALGAKLGVRGRFALGLFARQRGICNMSREQVGRVFADRPSSRDNGSGVVGMSVGGDATVVS